MSSPVRKSVSAAAAGPPEVRGIGEAETFELVRRSAAPILAVGAERQSSACFCEGDRALLFRSVGDLMDPSVYRAFRAQIDAAARSASFSPAVIAHDLHPLYLSTHYARQAGLPLIAVQHHHAHIASVMAERRHPGPVLGICCDGIGFGDDGAAWGCEIMYCTASEYLRTGHLEYFPLLGGDAAAIDTWRSAFALVQQAVGRCEDLAPFERVPADQMDVMRRLSRTEINAPPTSSLGRVFDGVSFLLGLCDHNDRPAQAAMALERIALAEPVSPYPYQTTVGRDGVLMSLAPMIRAIVRDVTRAEDPRVISARFHETVARMLAAAAQISAERNAISTVVLSGGCFANRLLRDQTRALLERRRFAVLLPERSPVGDAGIALGQAVVATARLEGGR